MVWLSGLLPYQQGAEVFERIGHRHIPATRLWNQTQRHGERLKHYVDRQQFFVGVERVILPAPGLDHRERKGVSMDGGMVNIRDEGWKEMKVGTVFDIELRLERDPHTRDLVEQPHGVNMAYTAVLGSVNQFGPALWALAVQHDVPTALESSVTADGAEWIWNLTADYFPASVQIVDWYHACQHLAKAAQALHPEDSEATQRWFRQRCENLFKGEIHIITALLEKADLSQYTNYFHTHKRRMQYQRFHAEGFPIGSGTVESGIKQFKARLTGPGMRWSRPSAEQMLVIRSAVMGQSFDALWNAA